MASRDKSSNTTGWTGANRPALANAGNAVQLNGCFGLGQSSTGREMLGGES
jgi:hypothetical protein